MELHNNRQVHYDAAKALTLARGVQDWHRISPEVKTSSPQALDDPYAIVSHAKLEGFEGKSGSYHIRVLVKSSEDYIPRIKNPLNRDKRYVLEVHVNGMEVYTTTDAKVKETFRHASRKGSRLTTFAQEVA